MGCIMKIGTTSVQSFIGFSQELLRILSIGESARSKVKLKH